MRAQAANIERINPEQRVKIAVTADWQVRGNVQRPRMPTVKQLRRVIEQITDQADVAVIAGDLVDQQRGITNGWKAEALRICKEIGEVGAGAKTRWFYVFGNHDRQNNEDPRSPTDFSDEMRRIYEGEIGMLDLQGAPYIHNKGGRGIGVAGCMGGGGGIKPYMIDGFGEPIHRQYYYAGKDEAASLDRDLRSLRGQGVRNMMVVTHFAPIRETLGPEPPEINIAMGNSHLEEVIDRNSRWVRVAVHGHAHIGSLEGMTEGGVRVFNAALPLMLSQRGDPAQPYLLYIL